MKRIKRIAALCVALPALAIGCKKPSEAPAPGSVPGAAKLSRGPTPRPGIPAKYDPARKMVGRAPTRTKVPLARLRKSAPSRSTPTRVGQGSLGFTLAGKKERLSVRVYEHRGRYHLAAQRPGLDAMLVLSSLEPGTFTPSTASRWPSLKLSLGAGRGHRTMTSATGPKMQALKVLIRRSGEALTGTFAGQVRGRAGKARIVSDGIFEIRLGVATPRRRRRVLGRHPR